MISGPLFGGANRSANQNTRSCNAALRQKQNHFFAARKSGPLLIQTKLCINSGVLTTDVNLGGHAVIQQTQLNRNRQQKRSAYNAIECTLRESMTYIPSNDILLFHIVKRLIVS